jgi:hypothetical protein
MVSTSILVAIVVAAVAVAVFIIRARGGAKPDKPAPPARRPPPEVAATPSEDFDPNATQVYLRPSPTAGTAARRGDSGAAPVIAGARLVALSGGHKGATFPVNATGITVGRHQDCDIVLADPRISGHHAWIGLVEGKAMLRDLGSTNGTFLNAQIHTSVKESGLRSGDTIFFGGHQGDQFRFVAD